jgi:hypothetical protein
MNAAITDLVHCIERGETKPAFERLDDLRRVAVDPLIALRHE